MIYAGDKKAKLYHGDYGPAQFYKCDVKIAGYTDAEKVGTSICGVDTYNDQLNLTIEGRSEQEVTVLGKNLFSKPNAQSYYPTATSWFHLKRGRYVVSIKQPAVQAWRFVFYIQKDGIAPDDTTIPTHLKMYVPASTTTTGYSALEGGYRQYIWNNNETWIYQTIELDADYDVSFNCFNAKTFENVQFEVATEIIQLPTPYEPFIPDSPSPDYPSPIRSSENFDVVSCGRNPATATTAHVTDPLRSVGNVSDSIEVSTGKVTFIKRLTTTVLDHTSGFYKSGYSNVNRSVFEAVGQLTTPANICDFGGKALCTHIKKIVTSDDSGYFQPKTLALEGGRNRIWITLPPIINTVEQFNAWLMEEKSAGRPVTIFYPLDAPTRTDITATTLGQALLAMRAYPYYTQVYTNATLPPTLRAKIREIV